MSNNDLDLELPLDLDESAPQLELEMEPELEAELELPIEGDQAPQVETTDVAAAPAAEMPVAQILPADFQLPTLIKFVPDVALRQALETAVATGLAIEVKGEEGMAAADVALTDIRSALKAIEANFEEPKALAHQLHKGITTALAAWKEPGDDAVKLIGSRMFNEKRRLDQIARDEARRLQEIADAEARLQAEREAQSAVQSNAPAGVVEELKERAKTATAAPVSTVSTFTPRGNSAVVTWKARIKGTPGTDDPNPSMDQLTATQKAQVLELMRAVVAGTQPLTCFDINWSGLNARAKAEKNTLEIVGIEAFESGGMRAKGARKS